MPKIQRSVQTDYQFARRLTSFLAAAKKSVPAALPTLQAARTIVANLQNFRGEGLAGQEAFARPKSELRTSFNAAGSTVAQQVLVAQTYCGILAHQLGGKAIEEVIQPPDSKPARKRIAPTTPQEQLAA